MMKGGVPNSRMSNNAAGVQVQSSLYGQAVPFLAGRSKLSPKLVWLGALRAVKQDTGKKGSKYGGDTYRYYAACDFLLGHYPIRTPMSLWINKDLYNVIVGVETKTVSGGSVTLSVSASYFLGVIAVTTPVTNSGTFDDYGGDGPLAYNLTQARPLWNQHFPLPDGSAGSGRAPYTYDWQPSYGRTINLANGSGALNGHQVTVYYAYYPKSVMPLPALNLEFEPYLASVSGMGVYNWVTGMYSSKFDLGVGNMFPTIALECIGAHALFPTGDCDPADLITDLITSGVRTAADSPHAGEAILITHGLNLTDTQITGAPLALGSLLGDVSLMSNYCLANDIKASLYLDSQAAARDVLQDLFDIANTAPVLSGDKLKCIPYSEVTAVGNGVVYTPPTAGGPICDLDDPCFAEGGLPEVDRNRQADADNVQPIQYISRQGMYESRTISEIDQRSVAQFNTRKASVRQMNAVHDDVVAEKVASVMVKRSAFLRNATTFRLRAEFSFLEAMDLVRVADYRIFGVTQWRPVRLTSVKENWDDKKGLTLDCTAEQFIYGLNAPTPMEIQPTNQFTPIGTADPGNVNPPLFLELPDSVADGFNLWVAVSGSDDNYGGCAIMASIDGVNYKEVGVLLGNSKMGTLTAQLLDNADPDNTHTLSVDLTSSTSDLDSFSSDEKDAFVSLCYVGGELVSYQTATLTGTNLYDLTSLRRGLYGTPTSTHAIGATFIRLDQDVVKLALPVSWIGHTISFKFLAFNKLGAAMQGLADVSPYTYTLQGHYQNFSQIIAINSKVDSVGTPGGGPFTAATVRVYSSSGGVGTNMTATKSDGTQITGIPAASFTGKALTTTYFAMWNPGNNTTYLLSDYNAMIAAVKHGHLCLGSTTTPNSGGSGGSSGGGGGIGGGGCPCDWLFDGDAPLQTISAGYMLTAVDPPTGRTWKEPVKSVGRKRARCFLLIAENGAVWAGSWDTPFTLRNGKTVLCEEMHGHFMLTPLGWSKVNSYFIGEQDVLAINIGGKTFYSNVQRGIPCASHNMAKPIYEGI